MVHNRFETGDWVVFRKTKQSEHPGPRARNVTATAHGDLYAYTVDKFWIVVQVYEDGRVRMRTRQGKEHVLRADHPQLHRANWWQRLVHYRRFRSIAGDAQVQA